MGTDAVCPKPQTPQPTFCCGAFGAKRIGAENFFGPASVTGGRFEEGGRSQTPPSDPPPPPRRQISVPQKESPERTSARPQMGPECSHSKFCRNIAKFPRTPSTTPSPSGEEGGCQWCPGGAPAKGPRAPEGRGAQRPATKGGGVAHTLLGVGQRRRPHGTSVPAVVVSFARAPRGSAWAMGASASRAPPDRLRIRRCSLFGGVTVRPGPRAPERPKALPPRAPSVDLRPLHFGRPSAAWACPATTRVPRGRCCRRRGAGGLAATWHVGGAGGGGATRRVPGRPLPPPPPDVPLASGRETGSQQRSAPSQRPLSNTRPPAPPELSRNVPRPACGSVGPCSIRSCLSWQTLVARLLPASPAPRGSPANN